MEITERRRTSEWEKASDYQLIQAFQGGNREVFALLVERHKDKLVNFLSRIVGNYDTACDLAQDTFLKVFTRADQYKPTHAFSTWLYRIGANIAINHLRRRKILRIFSISDERPGTDGLTYEQIVASKEPGPDALIGRAEDIAQVQAALNSLPLKYRVPLVLREIEELEYQEIGKILKLAPGTVKSRIFRGREELKKKLQRIRLHERGEHSL